MLCVPLEKDLGDFLLDLDQEAQLFLRLADCCLRRALARINSSTGKTEIVQSRSMPLDQGEFACFDQNDPGASSHEFAFPASIERVTSTSL